MPRNTSLTARVSASRVTSWSITPRLSVLRQAGVGELLQEAGVAAGWPGLMFSVRVAW